MFVLSKAISHVHVPKKCSYRFGLSNTFKIIHPKDCQKLHNLPKHEILSKLPSSAFFFSSISNGNARKTVESSLNDGSISSCTTILSSSTSKHHANKMAKLLSEQSRKELELVRNEVIGSSASRSTMNETTNAKSSEAIIPPPSRRELYLVALNQGLPFIGFGIVDNALLIIAGEAIDDTLGVMLGISTMCAAALGNIVSDLGGVVLSTIIEDYCAKLGLPVPNLTTSQRSLRSVRFMGQLGTAIGLTIGCIIGMFPLLFYDKDCVKDMKKDDEINAIFHDIEAGAKKLVNAESASLFLLKDERQRVCTRTCNLEEELVFDLNDKDIISLVISKKEAIIENSFKSIYHDTKAISLEADGSIDSIQQIICVPIFDVNEKVIGVIQATNKTIDSSSEGFTVEDVQTLVNLGTHISIAFQNIKGHPERDSPPVSMKDTIKLMKLQKV